ncbi:MAG TPA: DUF2087 domain-containing protein [Pseudonocardiaceae bacterium]|jgi:hypothetical protein|nr:DUF2087 domain-containing protein [Pseudonocardiaceae bacterium]
MDAAALVRVLAEPVRMKVFAAAVLGADSTAYAAELAGITVREAAAAVHRLAEAGVAEIVGERLVARTEVFAELARQSAAPRPVEDHGYTDPKVASAVGTFVRDGRLVGLPAQRGRRLHVLEHLAQSFEPGVDYPETRVNEILAGLAEGGSVDHVTLRRYLVDEELLRRSDGVYRRSGGPVDV